MGIGRRQALTAPPARGDNGDMSRKQKGKGAPGAGGGPPEIQVTCPCCQTRLLVNAASGAIIREDRKKKPARSFEDALTEEKARRASTDALFGKALKSQKDQQAVLERKFQEAIKKAADEPDEETPRPVDWD